MPGVTEPGPTFDAEMSVDGDPTVVVNVAEFEFVSGLGSGVDEEMLHRFKVVPTPLEESDVLRGDQRP